jgi:hypothetical protein
MDIDSKTYDKHAKHAVGFGYEARNSAPTSLIVHSTSNPNVQNTAFTAEARFLLNSPLVSAHFLVSKTGKIVQFLDPLKWAAWHAGNCKPAFVNQRSIGIELHHSVGDAPYPKLQMDALGALMIALGAQFNIPFGMMETHGQVALPGPYKRKTDPSDMSHPAFLAWRDQLVAAPPPPRPYRARGLPIHQAPDVTSPVALGGAAILMPGAIIHPDQIKDGWAHVPEGFIDVKALEAI